MTTTRRNGSGPAMPHAPDAEEALVGYAMQNARQAGEALALVAPAQCYLPALRTMYEAVAGLFDDMEPCGLPATLERLRSTGTLEQAGGRERVGQVWSQTGGQLHGYARDVLRAWRHRQCIALADDLRQAGLTRAPDDEIDALVAALEDRVALPDADRDRPEELVAALDAWEPPAGGVDWVVRGLIARREKAMILGPAGFGKSTLLRQIGVCASQGLHPFSRSPERAVRVLSIDLENERDDILRAYTKLRDRFGEMEMAWRPDQFWFRCRPQGINLLTRRDRDWLERRVESVRPELLMIGPMYKAYRGTAKFAKHSEEAAAAVADVIDDLRVRFDCAVLMETHSGHAEPTRPIGSALWTWWPTVGLAMVKLKGSETECELVRFRGFRDRNRNWPPGLVAGHNWPWEEIEL